GRRRGRRGGGGGGGSREAAAGPAAGPTPTGNGTAPHGPHGKGGGAPEREQGPERQPREDTAQPGPEASRETQQNPSEQPHSIAHFEPSPPLEGNGGGPSKPYVVWSSAPAEPSHDPGRDEGGG
ncbi:MAG: hypothetical protein ACREUT_08770, partial [Steroidobacteraceae bacterium]